ncbi:hypothetical protein M426DRAFT_11519 [Hypoxylon sp. CI-4A]|nr:hypothetical protein M426DRAFT_11519 [Hypoxylon sp. CI-4A]
MDSPIYQSLVRDHATIYQLPEDTIAFQVYHPGSTPSRPILQILAPDNNGVLYDLAFQACCIITGVVPESKESASATSITSSSENYEIGGTDSKGWLDIIHHAEPFFSSDRDGLIEVPVQEILPATSEEYDTGRKTQYDRDVRYGRRPPAAIFHQEEDPDEEEDNGNRDSDEDESDPNLEPRIRPWIYDVSTNERYREQNYHRRIHLEMHDPHFETPNDEKILSEREENMLSSLNYQYIPLSPEDPLPPAPFPLMPEHTIRWVNTVPRHGFKGIPYEMDIFLDEYLDSEYYHRLSDESTN